MKTLKLLVLFLICFVMSLPMTLPVEAQDGYGSCIPGAVLWGNYDLWTLLKADGQYVDWLRSDSDRDDMPVPTLNDMDVLGKSILGVTNDGRGFLIAVYGYGEYAYIVTLETAPVYNADGSYANHGVCDIFKVDRAVGEAIYRYQ